MSVLDEAARAVHGDRGRDYGHPSVNHAATAAMMKAYLQRRYGPTARFDALDTCAHNIVQKLSRLAHTHDHRDSLVDIAGYAANWEMILQVWTAEGRTNTADYLDIAGGEGD